MAAFQKTIAPEKPFSFSGACKSIEALPLPLLFPPVLTASPDKV
jgi:hypothetical protein